MPEGIWVNIKIVKRDEGKSALVDLGIEGVAKKRLKNGYACFNDLKLKSTSYCHEVKAFIKIN